MVQSQLACSPKRGPDTRKQENKQGSPAGGEQAKGAAFAYNTDQAISDKAQGMTIAFDALAFLTGDLGDQMLSILDADQAQLITRLVDIQKPSLLDIVDTRRKISIELRKFLAANFTKVSQSLTSE